MRAIGRRVAWMASLASMVATSVLPVQGIAATTVGQDQVLSISIKPADGTSGQSITTGSGVKTEHIQDGAVTASKLGVVCPDGQYLQYSVTSGWVCNVGAGPQGPTGPQGSQGVKGDTGATGPQGPVGLMAHYSNVIVVAKSGGDFTNPVEALASISDASETNRYLIKIMPGVYDITGLENWGGYNNVDGNGTLFLQSYVDIEGSGETNTVIVSNLRSQQYGVINGNGASCALRKLKIVNPTGWNQSHYAYAVILHDSRSYLEPPTVNFDMSDVVIEIPNAASDHTVVGISGGYPGPITLNNVKINLPSGFNGYGITDVFTMKNSEINMKQGMTAISGPFGSSIANSMINGTIDGSGIKCFGNYDYNLMPVTCP